MSYKKVWNLYNTRLLFNRHSKHNISRIINKRGDGEKISQLSQNMKKVIKTNFFNIHINIKKKKKKNRRPIIKDGKIISIKHSRKRRELK